MFKHVNNAQTPYDIINVHIEGVRKVECTKCEKIIKQFGNKYYSNDK